MVVGTNRPGANTRKVAREIEAIYAQMGVPLAVLDLAELPKEIFDPSSYATKPAGFKRFTEGVLNATGLIIVTPEYNGSVPGVLKYFIDMLKFPESFEGRPVCFVGVAAGMWGALRPIEMLQQIFGYRNALIYPQRVFMPGINGLLDENGRLKDEEIRQRLRDQADGFVDFVEKLKLVKLKPMKSFAERLAVCSWSLQPETPEALFKALDEIGIKRVQIALDPIRENPAWKNFPEQAAARGVTCVSGMMTTIGEDYTTMESIRLTGGVTPDATWDQNWKNIQEVAALAKKMGLKLVTFHAGFMPHDESDPLFGRLMERIRKIADLFAEHGLDLGFETGQEEGKTLKIFLEKLGRKNVGVNFDPANMILYGMGNPNEALRALAPWLKQCHIKDATKTKTPGTWGEEVPSGTGQVNWSEFFATLRELKFEGWCCIEREAGAQRVADIKAAKQMVERVTAGK
jgi:L-ribulose-5-phosphate 3-epimerase